MRTLVLSVINLTLPEPHGPKRYVEAMRKAYAQQRVVKIRGDFAGMIGSLRADENDPTILHGEFYKFMDLQAERGWFDLRERRPAEPDDLAAIQIPDHLRPHFQFLPFVFYGGCHRLVMVSRDGDDVITPKQAARVLQGALRAAGEQPKLTVEPQREVLDEILAMPRLRKLTLQIVPPNPDGLAEAERKLLQEMRNQNAQRLQIELDTRDADGLRPDERTQTLARIAQSNGKVVAKGGEHGQTHTVSTADHPLEDKVAYDPDTDLRQAVFLDRARALLVRLGILRG